MSSRRTLQESWFTLYGATTLALLLCVPAMATANTRWIPAQGSSWWWQIENSESLNTAIEADIYDIDLFDGIESGTIAELQELGKRVVCYFSAGTYEPWRSDASAFTDNMLISGASLPQFDEETWLNIGDATAVESGIKPIMQARLDMASSAGCDGVEPDNVDGYANEETAGTISLADQLAYNRWLAQAAHARGLSVGLKNAVELLPDLVDDFDFAVNEQCYAYGNECVKYESTFLAAGKAVFNQEYGGSGDGGQISKSTFDNTSCPYFQRQRISSLWKRTLNLDGAGVAVCALEPVGPPEPGVCLVRD